MAKKKVPFTAELAKTNMNNVVVRNDQRVDQFTEFKTTDEFSRYAGVVCGTLYTFPADGKMYEGDMESPLDLFIMIEEKQSKGHWTF